KIEHRQPDLAPADGAGARADSLVQAFIRELVDGRLVWLGDLPVQKVVGADITPPLLPGPAIGDESNPGIAAEPEMVAARAHIGVITKHVDIKADATTRAVRRQRDGGQLAAREGAPAMRLRQLHHMESTPTTDVH